MCPKFLRPRLAVLELSDSSSSGVQGFSLILSRPVSRRERAEERLREARGACYPPSGLLLNASLLQVGHIDGCHSLHQLCSRVLAANCWAPLHCCIQGGALCSLIGNLRREGRKGLKLATEQGGQISRLFSHCSPTLPVPSDWVAIIQTQVCPY